MPTYIHECWIVVSTPELLGGGTLWQYEDSAGEASNLQENHLSTAPFSRIATLHNKPSAASPAQPTNYFS